MDRPPLQRQGSRVRFAEGQEVLPDAPSPPRTESPPGRGDAAPTPPGVYWAEDRESGPNPNSSNYTFYRESTPPPPESDDHEKLVRKHREGIVADPKVFPTLQSPIPLRPASAFPPYEATRFDPTQPASDDESGRSEAGAREIQPDNRKKYRWLFIAIAVLFVTVPIGVGTGVALGLKRGSSAASSAPATTTSSGSALSSSSAIATPTTVTSSPAANATSPPRIVTDPVECPEANNTLYVVPGSSKTFLRTCGIDYTGIGGATDLAHIYTTSMGECMNVCASYDLCTGCGWGMIDGDVKGNHRCWMKNGLKTPHKARDDYCFAVLQI